MKRKMNEDIVRVLRIIEYVGPRKWVETTVSKSIQGTMLLDNGAEIRAATIGEYPEILEITSEQRRRRSESDDETTDTC